MNKFGKFILCLVPTLGFLALQIVVTIVAEIVWMVKGLDMSLFATDPSAAMNNVIVSMTTDSNFLMSVTIMSQVVGFIIAVIIYMTVFKQRKLESPGKVFGPSSIVSIVILMISLELSLSCIMIKAYDWIPNIMESYAEMIEESGLADMTVLSTIATLIMAPLGEELVFRGMTLNLAGRLTKKFWIANFIQAACFGIAHLNLVQGTYAFILGMLLGYIYKKYNSIYATIIAHLTFNFSGTYLVSYIFPGEEAPAYNVFYAILAGAALIGVLAFYSIVKDGKTKERAAMYMARVHKVYSPGTEPFYYKAPFVTPGVQPLPEVNTTSQENISE